MQTNLQPWDFLLVILAGWLQHRQQQIIEFQNDQITSLLKQMGKKRILLTDDQRRLLAVKGKALCATGAQVGTQQSLNHYSVRRLDTSNRDYAMISSIGFP